eukprot:CAMPEP_0202704412 /NCGR_PEP_ID=MMETSP1385-20130828/17091_1 /ASSEMBLY_ACC=CAM_ASM_000861 /TAXON_ID=933848 /ORGANISM="Elphidium margaritaceum" /LENGTH=64 /DNA_ID=CAMNT_0049362427 /DNA_START=90 /DNA_END=281 /DNA_ORIENTATION=-
MRLQIRRQQLSDRGQKHRRRMCAVQLMNRVTKSKRLSVGNLRLVENTGADIIIADHERTFFFIA